jgi:hypothetical protein
MTSNTRFLTIISLFLAVAGAAQALEGAQLIASDSARPARRHPAPVTEEARGDNGMQAICREILVDTDEGYGVTNRESRVICDELR